MGGWILLAVVVVACLVLRLALQPAGRRAQRLQERVRADRRAAQAPLRPDPEPGRDRQGLHEARARNARGRDQGAQQRGQRPQGRGRRIRATPAAMQQLCRAENALTGALGRLFALAEAYPDLKANQNMMQLTEELTSTENKVAFARQAYNDAVMGYNNQREMFPAASSPACSISRRRSCWSSRSPRRARRRRSPSPNHRGQPGVDFFDRQDAARRTTRGCVVAFLLVPWRWCVVARRSRSSCVLRAARRDPQALAAAVAASRCAVIARSWCWPSSAAAACSRHCRCAPAAAWWRARWAARASSADTPDPALRRLHNVVEEMAIASGVPVPEVFCSSTRDGINAFAAGYSPATRPSA